MALNPWLTFSLLFFAVWIIVWSAKKNLRKEMLWSSLIAAPFGLTEPLFVPEYWSPPSLFDLAMRTGFDIESIIFCFSIGGIAAVLYELLFKRYHVKMTTAQQYCSHHRYHLLALASGPLVFIVLALFTEWNHIYCAAIALFVGAASASVCRPDLKKKIIAGGFLFLGLYTVFFILLTQLYPGIVEQVWNLDALSGLLFLGIPLEEFMFAFTFGMYWSSIYEHVYWYKLKKIS